MAGREDAAVAKGAGFAALGPLARHWPEAGTALLLLAVAPALLSVTLTHDSAWQMWIGRRILHGANLYTDVVEVNPPLWFWIAAPLARVADLTGTEPRQILIAFILAVTAGSLILLSRLLRDRPPAERAGLYAAALFCLLALPLRDFGQREHFTLIATLLYVALAARRADNGPASPGLAIAAGVFAAFGLALKPHFAAVPLALEAWLWLAFRIGPRRPETLAVVGGLATYWVATVVLEPDFWSDVLPMAMLAYGGFGTSLAAQIPLQVVAVVLLAVLGVAAGGWPRSKLAEASLVAGLVFLAIYAAQMKGWRYQAIPALGFLLLAAAAELIELRHNPRGRTVQAALLVSTFVAALSFPIAGTARNPLLRETTPLMAGLQPGEGAFVISASSMPLWPMVEQRGLVWPSRYFAFWMLPAIARNPHDSALSALADRVRRETAQDIACNPPAVILIDNHRGFAPMPPRFDTLRFFLASPEFAAAFRQYRRSGGTYRFTAFTRTSMPRERKEGDCRR